MLKTNDKPRKTEIEAQTHCEVNLGYHIGAQINIQLRDNWPVRTYKIITQQGCDAYRVVDVNSGRGFNFHPSIHPHEFV